MTNRHMRSLFLLAALSSLTACNDVGSKPPESPPDTANAPLDVMEVPASAETTRADGIVKWQFDTATDGTIELTGFDARGATPFTGKILKPDAEGVVEYQILSRVLRIGANGQVVESTLSAEAADFLGRLNADTQAYAKSAQVALSPCSQAVDYYNVCATAAAVACGICVAQPETCAACVLALNAEGQARSARDEICGSDGCGNHCAAPFTCDSGTGNCICVSSCSGPMCGQTDGCGNACPSWDVDTCGVCGGDGNSCCPYFDCFGQCGGSAYYDYCDICVYSDDEDPQCPTAR